MGGLLALGIGLGAGFQAMRQYPANGPVAPEVLYVVLLVGMIAAYFGGRYRGRGRGATATATATATAAAAATNTVNVAVFTAEKPESAVRVPAESAPWLSDRRQEITADVLEGLDLEDMGFELRPADLD